MLNGSVHQEDITIVNIYVPNSGLPKYIKQVSNLKGVIDNTTIIGDFNTPLSIMDRSSRQKINKETLDLAIL